jgi:hypothetical protein
MPRSFTVIEHPSDIVSHRVYLLSDKDNGTCAGYAGCI